MNTKKIKSSSIHGIIEQSILNVLKKNPTKTFNYKQLAHQINLHKKQDRDIITVALDNLVNAGEIINPDRGKYKLKHRASYVEGIIDFTNRGAAYVTTEEHEEDIFISPKNVRNALQGDKVKISLLAKKKKGQMEGEVIAIINRARTEFVGIVRVSPKFAFFIADSSKMTTDIFIPLKDLNKAVDGQKAIAEITDWIEGSKNPIGKITKVLGWPGDNDAEMDAILADSGFPLEFSKETLDECAKIPAKISKKDLVARRDFRGVITFTIDPYDAKDFDDALSYKKLDNGNYEIGIHIADVSHYIQPDTALDEEANYRGTSVYLVDRVIPMLPEKLSNNLCSLRPNEDKLCFSAVFEMTEDGKVMNEWFGRTVIHSIRRFTYEEAQEVIETGLGDLNQEIKIMNKIAVKLRKERFKHGAIAFEKPEIKFKLDERGMPVDVYIKEIKDSNKLIEEYMLLANRKVAEFIGKQKDKEGEKKTFVYRVHDAPVLERLNSFAAFANKFGYKIQTKTHKEISHSLNKLMNDVHGTKEQNVLEQLAIRTMSKAVYTTKNIGHYGLAFDYYTHFTSPIRRYPDVMVHRLLEHYLKGGKSVDESQYENSCKHSSHKEMKATEAERSSIKYKQVQFLQDKTGIVFEGLISGVTEWGMYVEIIENKCEGMVRLRDMDDDFYELDEANYCLIGSRRKKKYQIGDTVFVKIKSTDLTRKQIDFFLIKKHSDS